MAHESGQLSHGLASNIERLVRELLPHGKREGAEWVHPSLSGTSHRSLSVRLYGRKAGVWSDFSSGEVGDALALVAMVLFRGDRRTASIWARSWLNCEEAAPEYRRRTAPPTQPPNFDVESEARRSAARRIFNAAQQVLLGTPVDAYLAGRGISLGELGAHPCSLRFHPCLPNRETDLPWPAMVAAVANGAGDLIAVHRTWLQRDAGGKWIKAMFCNPKMSLGSLVGGTIRLWRGQTRTPLANAQEGETVILTEGIEDGLSCALLCPELRVLSTVNLSNMARIELPPLIRIVIIAADNDGENQAAAKALQRAIERFVTEGRTVRIARSPVGKDFNDFLRAATT
jgi:Toprim domain